MLIWGIVGAAVLIVLAAWAWAIRRREDATRAKFAREYPLLYEGPSTIWGLTHGQRCRETGKGASGMRIVETIDGRRWQVPHSHLAPGRGAKVRAR